MAEDRWPWRRLGDAAKGEIELDPESVEDPASWRYRDPYFALRRDRVTFPGGREGEYVSLHAASGNSTAGVVMLPMWGDRCVLLRTYRHAPRSWQIEAPRGFIDGGESAAAAAMREMQEEYGVIPASLEFLGHANPDTGLMAYDVAFFIARLQALPVEARGDTGGGECVEMSPDDLWAAVARGEIADGLLLTALALASARKQL